MGTRPHDYRYQIPRKARHAERLALLGRRVSWLDDQIERDQAHGGIASKEAARKRVEFKFARAVRVVEEYRGHQVEVLRHAHRQLDGIGIDLLKTGVDVNEAADQELRIYQRLVCVALDRFHGPAAPTL